jgi:hypothetical protein
VTGRGAGVPEAGAEDAGFAGVCAGVDAAGVGVGAGAAGDCAVFHAPCPAAEPPCAGPEVFFGALYAFCAVTAGAGVASDFPVFRPLAPVGPVFVLPGTSLLAPAVALLMPPPGFVITRVACGWAGVDEAAPGPTAFTIGTLGGAAGAEGAGAGRF